MHSTQGGGDKVIKTTVWSNRGTQPCGRLFATSGYARKS